MSHDSERQTVLFPGIFEKPVVVRFDDEHLSSNAGAVFLRRVDRRLGLIDGLAKKITDRRDATRTNHEVVDLLRQRILCIALGYSDCNDAAKIGSDPILKMCASHSPTGDSRLASQPTLSRFENSVSFDNVSAMQAELARRVVSSCRRRYGKHVKRITIDLDPTDDPTYGGQQLALFNDFYKNWCYLPLMGFLKFDDEPEHHLFLAMLRPGNAPATQCAHEAIEAISGLLRENFRDAEIVARLDGAYATPKIFNLLERLRLKYVVNMAKNPVLERLAKNEMYRATWESRELQSTASVFGEAWYSARSWKGKTRRVVIKGEVTRLEGRQPRSNPRFVITNMKGTAESVYRFYCGRGEAENGIKELKLDLSSGRTSCTSFAANQLRLTMTAAAYVLMQELRLDAAADGCERLRVGTFRDRFLKIAARVVESVRRVVLTLPMSYPWKRVFCRLAVT